MYVIFVKAYWALGFTWFNTPQLLRESLVLPCEIHVHFDLFSFTALGKVSGCENNPIVVMVKINGRSLHSLLKYAVVEFNGETRREPALAKSMLVPLGISVH